MRGITMALTVEDFERYTRPRSWKASHRIEQRTLSIIHDLDIRDEDSITVAL